VEFSYLDTRTPAGWQEWKLVNADVGERGVGVERALAPESVDGDLDAVDVDIDDCRDLYVLDSAGYVYRYDGDEGEMVRLPCLGPGGDGLTDPCALCVTSDTIYVADGADGRVRALSRELLQRRWVSERRFDDPVGIVGDGEGVSVLDAGTDRGEGRLVRLDGGGAVSSSVSGFGAPSDLTIDRAGNRYVLDVERDERDDGGYSVIRKFPDGIDYRLEEPGRRLSCIAAVDVNEVLAAGARDAGGGTTLYRCLIHRNSREAVDSFGRGCSTLVAPRERETSDVEELFAIDGVAGATEVYRLVGGGKTRRNDRTFGYDAQLITRLDSGERGTRWHRLTLDFDLEGRDTQVRVSYYATDEKWLRDSSDLQRIDRIGESYAHRLEDEGITSVSELASLDPSEITDRIDVSEKITGPWPERARKRLVDWSLENVEWRRLGEPNPSDALLDSAEGQYLWVKIELIGNERSSPRIRGFRAYFPRRSSLRHLPSVYRQDEAAGRFLERFLSMFSSLFTDVEAEIEGVTSYMDPEGIPADGLSWLESWMALETDETWPESARRELLSRAPELSKKRGTKAGLLETLQIYLRHTRPRSAWREALDIDAGAIVETVTELSEMPEYDDISHTEAKRKLGEREALRSLSGEPELCHMIAAWSRVLRRERELLDSMDAAGYATEATRDEHGTLGDLLGESDEGSLRYIAEYAVVLGELAERAADEDTPEEEVNADAERAEYESLIRETADRNVPYLVETPDLDCIDDEGARKPYADLVGRERGFVVLARSVDGERMRTLRRIVDAEQPAHAVGRAIRLRPWIRLGGHSYLGINSDLTKRELVLDRSGLGDESVLDAREPFAQLGVKSRLDRDSFIS
jgi:phage tail-like protein